MSPEEERELAEKLERKRKRTIQRLQVAAESVRCKLEIPPNKKIRYEPRASTKDGWANPIHIVIARHKVSGAVRSKSYRFYYDMENEEDLNRENFQALVKEKMLQAINDNA